MSPTEALINAMEMWFGISMNQAMGKQLQAAREKGLSMPQIGMLFRTFNSPAGVFELGQEIGISGAAASQMIDRLVQQGLVMRNESPHDRRVKEISLTDYGRITLRSFMAVTHSWFEDVAARLTVTEKEQVTAAFVLLNNRIAAMPASQKPACDPTPQE